LNNQERQARVAIGKLSDLDAWHKKFMAHVRSEADFVIDGGSVTSEKNVLQVTVLGVVCVAQNRPVALEGVPVANEYSFVAKFEGEDLPVWGLYLDQNGALYEDSTLATRFCDYNNTYVRSKIVFTLANKLLQSPLFAPKK
jgi:hypothetical protein